MSAGSPNRFQLQLQSRLLLLGASPFFELVWVGGQAQAQPRQKRADSKSSGAIKDDVLQYLELWQKHVGGFGSAFFRHKFANLFQCVAVSRTVTLEDRIDLVDAFIQKMPELKVLKSVCFKDKYVPEELSLNPLKRADGVDYCRLKVAWLKIYHGYVIDWENSSVENKNAFLLMVRNVALKSAILRKLLLDIGELTCPIHIILHNPRTGTQFIDSFAYDTVNLGDLLFFPETPSVERPFEMTRGEHVVHILAERWKYAKCYFDYWRFRQAHQVFNPCHRYACEVHNAYRAEQGQPQEKDPLNPTVEAASGGGKTTFTYTDGSKLVVVTDQSGKPLEVYGGKL